MSRDPENLQSGSAEVTKVSDRVLCARRQGSTSVEWLLTMLECRGFKYSPKFLGLSNDDRQVLESIEGQAGAYPLPEELHHGETFTSMARALRPLHEVTSKLVTEVLDGWMLEAVEPYEVICHGDFAPYNCVFNRGGLIGIVDFNTAHPGPHIHDIAYATYRFAPLTVPENVAGFGSLTEQARRARLFCDKYEKVSRSGIIEAACQRLLDLVRCMCVQAAQSDTVFQSHLNNGHDTLCLRDVHYLGTSAATLTRALM